MTSPAVDAPCALRPFRQDDAGELAVLTLAAIRVTGLRAYSPRQVEAWAARYSAARLLEGTVRGDTILVAANAHTGRPPIR